MTEMRNQDGAATALPKSTTQLTSEQLSTPPRRLAGKVKNLQTAGFKGPRPWGGDKIAFEPVPGADQRALAKATAVIDEARKVKRVWKTVVEKRKEADIRNVKKLAGVLEELRPKKSIPRNSAAATAHQFELFTKLESGEINLPRALWPMAFNVVLMSDTDVIALNKNLLHRFHDDVGQLGGWNWSVMAKEFSAAGLVVREGDSGHEIRTADGQPVYTVHWGDDRVEPKAGEEGVLRQKGTAGLSPEDARRKEYVRDANGILTRRLQSREINYFHLANMVGLKVDAKADSVGPSGAPLGHGPRGEGRTVGGHATVLNVNDPAVVNPENWQGQYEPAGDPAEPLPASQRTGRRVRPTAPLGPDSPMDHNVASSMQVRNGSGPDQPRLSSTAVQSPVDGFDDKTIRGNKGEQFKETSDNVAAVEYDLVLAAKAGLSFVNQYSEDSHEFKIAYARYKEGTAEEKNSALKELDEYIYSARKNREVTISKVPNEIVTRIKLNGVVGIWSDSGLPVDRWLPFAEVSKQLAAHITAQRLHTAHWVSGFLDDQDSHAKQAKL